MAGDEVIDAEVVQGPLRAEPPVRWPEFLSVVLLVALADLTVYRGRGYAGYAALLAGGPWLLLWGAPVGRTWRGGRPWASIVIVGLMLLVLAARMLWSGWALHVAVGAVLMMAFALALSGAVPYLLEIVVFPARVMLGGLLGLAAYTRLVRWPSSRLGRIAGLSVILPLVTFLAFSLLFILANPDLLTSFGVRVARVLQTFRQWLIEFSPHPAEVIFWSVVGWIAMGMLRPLLSRPLFEDQAAWEANPKRGGAPSPSPLYAACRNTLATAIGLFAIYLVFEFQTLWFREFPPGFYYSGYAHQGAAWLTVALALATLILSVAFRGSILQDPRVRGLKLLAWIWSLENMLLALAVYHRLYIYIGFNGMTRMRMVGIFGITAVLVGFLLVLWKIARNRGILWLLHRHLWTVGIAVYLLSVTPVDVIVVRHNAGRILAGDSAPAVQISVHPISAEGLLYLPPLVDCDDVLVREGVTAYLAEAWEQAEARESQRGRIGWTVYQIADQQVLRQLRALADRLATYRDRSQREAALQRFHQYAYQWY
jgi:hypothetical protein